MSIATELSDLIILEIRNGSRNSDNTFEVRPFNPVCLKMRAGNQIMILGSRGADLCTRMLL